MKPPYYEPKAEAWVTKNPDADDYIATIRCDIPKCLVAQLRTHQRLVSPLALSCQSSRAVPVARMLEQVPFYIPRFVVGGRGMVEGGGVAASGLLEEIWLCAMDDARSYVAQLLDMNPTVSKGQINRLLEPFTLTRVVMTGTERLWSDFFELRCSEAAQSEMRMFADAVRLAIGDAAVNAQKKLLHVPFSKNIVEAVTVAAQTSYRADKACRDPERLFKQLAADRHWGPFEHVCFMLVPGNFEADHRIQGRFVGELVYPLRGFLDPKMSTSKGIQKAMLVHLCLAAERDGFTGYELLPEVAGC